mmetsp:Transcript_12997/g.35388  ORF Transcript_12997/g.35388 Transcript_12997/m.35388 type:complete len:361 (+) Transcript_12997:75-1157(+)
MDQCSAKACIGWATFALIWLVEVWIHARCGFQAELFELEGACLDSAGWAFWLEFGEGVCRSGIMVMLLGMVWESTALALGGELTKHVAEVIDDSGKVVFWGGWSAAILVLALGLWSICDEEGLPFWALLICHLADIFCHAFVASSLTGLIFDFGVAINLGQTRAFLYNFVRCSDSIEGHGVQDMGDGGGQNGTIGSFLKVLSMWGVFFLAVWIWNAQYWGMTVPFVLDVIFRVAGVACWGCIAWWMVWAVMQPRRAVMRMSSRQSMTDSGTPTRYDSKQSEEIASSVASPELAEVRAACDQVVTSKKNIMEGEHECNIDPSDRPTAAPSPPMSTNMWRHCMMCLFPLTGWRSGSVERSMN